jgi:wobble nucleotide-excising tRNase
MFILIDRPKTIFRYEDGEDKREIGRDELLSVLSTGEARALYLLNIIFELEARKKAKQETLLILDDIADSFDYKNKYAIIEYLKDILESDNFLMIILTHNFDFFRTVHSRLTIDRGSNCLMSMKTSTNVELIKAEYFNPFHYWRKHLKENTKILIASIPR